MRGWSAAALIAPALLLILVSVALPLFFVIANAFTNEVVPVALPRAKAAIEKWLPGTPIPPALAHALVSDIVAADEARLLPRLGSALENELSGFRTLINATARGLRDQVVDPADAHARLEAIDPRWADPAYWIALQRGVADITATHVIRAVDRKYDPSGEIVHVGPTQAVFVAAIGRTLLLSAVVTGLCIVLAYPVAIALAGTTGFWRAAVFVCVLLPFWTSLLVRTSAWMVLLQRQGIVNDALTALGVLGQRVQLINNRFGLVIAMVHILLPFVVLPLYAALTTIRREQVMAGFALGAGPVRIFWKVVLPQTLPGLRTGVALAFVVALGFYVTPALIGGPGDQMLSSYIASYINERLDWATASALSLILILLIAASCGLLVAVGRSGRAG